MLGKKYPNWVKLIGGIDPGLDGGLCNIDLKGNIVNCIPMPIKDNSGGKRQIDIKEVKKFFCSTDFIQLEIASAMPPFRKNPKTQRKEKVIQGVASMFNYGRDYGRILGWLETNDTQFGLVLPRIWKKYYDIKKEKKYSRELATRLSNSDLKEKPKSRVPHDGITESYLIARYALFNNKFNYV